ncbi:MAG TPA: phosphoenolpyruvate synthase [Candidatus Babeliales bacterium]|nr:phosphoenolpyruvate synthase [Candidatus Babeliales bacterium]
MQYIKNFKDVRLTDVATVGGKNASLGQMIADLTSQGVKVPGGFAITADAYRYFLERNALEPFIRQALDQLSGVQDLQNRSQIGAAIRARIIAGVMPEDLADEIIRSYKALSAEYHVTDCDVAVRSSATAEDLPDASFAGQQETFLNVRGAQALLERCKECMASLFTDRAIVYRITKGFDHCKVALSIGVQKMIRSDLACSGVAFSLDTETGFKDVVMVTGSFGLGEMIVQGKVIPDEFLVHKPTFRKGFPSIIKKQCGEKQTKMVYADDQTAAVKIVPVDAEQARTFCITDKELLELSSAVIAIEERYSALKGQWCPVDVEWAKDGVDGQLYIVQARPETVHAGSQHATVLYEWSIEKAHQYPKALLTGQSIGQKIVSGVVRIINTVADAAQVQEGDIIVTAMTDPDWVPAMKRSVGIITDRGGRTCHAAIVSRELGIPAIVGTHTAMQIFKTGQQITIDCSRGSVGYIYEGAIPFTKTERSLQNIPQPAVDVLVNIADPDNAFQYAALPVAGVGLARLEFLISNVVQIHPMALVCPERVADANVRKKIETITAGYSDKKQFFVDTVARGVGMIAAAFYPRPVIVRFSDFKTNEYASLIGGTIFEQEEENPMIGFRGASRYYNERYAQAFALECAAMVYARDVMGLTNITLMVPFVRTVAEAKAVIDLMAQYGLERGKNGLKVAMMVEVPSNVLLIEQFSAYFDGFSIGSNDLTQLTLGVDRDSEMLASLFDERDEAVKIMMCMAIEGAKKANRYIGICGQAPSDHPDVAQFLIESGITSISLNPDSVVSFLMRDAKTQ